MKMKEFELDLSKFEVGLENIKRVFYNIPTIDQVTGGIALGKITEIIGWAGTGKSSLALQSAASILYQDPSAHLVYIDTEFAVTKERENLLFSYYGLNPDDLAGSGRYKILHPSTLQEVIEIFNSVIATVSKFKVQSRKDTPPVFIIWDSLAATPTEQEVQEEETFTQIGLTARLMSLLLKKYKTVFGQLNITPIIVNQYRAKLVVNPYAGANPTGFTPGQKGAPVGGTALPFYSFTRLQLDGKAQFGSKTEPEGQLIEVRTLKNKLKGPVIADAVLHYKFGFDPIINGIELLISGKYISQSAGWYTLEGSGVKKRKQEIIDAVRAKADPETKLVTSLLKEKYNLDLILPAKTLDISLSAVDENEVHE